MTWEEAKSKCSEKGYVIATAKTAFQQKALESAILNNAAYQVGERVWIGMDDLKTEGLGILSIVWCPKVDWTFKYRDIVFYDLIYSIT